MPRPSASSAMEKRLPGGKGGPSAAESIERLVANKLFFYKKKLVLLRACVRTERAQFEHANPTKITGRPFR